jgi:hypothetical protein
MIGFVAATILLVATYGPGSRIIGRHWYSFGFACLIRRDVSGSCTRRLPSSPWGASSASPRTRVCVSCRNLPDLDRLIIATRADGGRTVPPLVVGQSYLSARRMNRAIRSCSFAPNGSRPASR